MRPRPPAGSDSLGRRLGLLLLLNALPIGTALTIFVLNRQGVVTVRSLPGKSVGHVVLIALTLVSIVALGWGVYPLLRNVREAARRRAKGILLPFWGAIWLLVALDLVVLGTLVLALFAVELVLLARFALSVN